jgi:hypothetical protein
MGLVTKFRYCYTVSNFPDFFSFSFSVQVHTVSKYQMELLREAVHDVSFELLHDFNLFEHARLMTKVN